MQSEDELIARLVGCLTDHKTRLYPPVSWGTVHTAENQLSFKLVPLLARVYTEVANGGIGPGDGILGLQGGHASDHTGDNNPRTLADFYLHWVSVYESIGVAWPAGLLPVCDWGCAVWSCVDCASSDGMIVTWHDKGLTETQRTLKSWFEAWLDGVGLWAEMFVLKQAKRPNPFKPGEMMTITRPVRAKGVERLKFPEP